MKRMQDRFFLISMMIIATVSGGFAQEKPMSLTDCISYALSRNIQVKQAALSGERDQLYTSQAKASRLPSLDASVRQNFDWNKSINTQTGSYGSLQGSNGTSYSVNSGMTLYNGMKINNQIKQSELNLQGSQYYTETIKESIELNILNAFLQVLYEQESVINAEKQIEASTQQLALAKERLDLSVISQSDYLQIKSELANEKLTLANSKSQLAIARVNLMQLMELPVNDNFSIVSPGLEGLLNQNRQPDASQVYETALTIKPQIMQAGLNKQSAMLDEKIAKADMIPSLSLDAGLGTSYSSLLNGFNYSEQFKNKISPAVGLTLSIPVFQRKQVKTNIGLARIGVADAELTETDTKNQLRKEIEQAAVDVVTAQAEYEASLEQYQAAEESNQVAIEKFDNGLMNSVDYLFEKTNLITSESNLLQSKYKLVFNYKILDFYKGTPLTF